MLVQLIGHVVFIHNALAEEKLYSIGEPTAKEQLYLELINRARANPTQEGVWLDSLYTNPGHSYIKASIDYFKVNRSVMKQEFVEGSASGKPVLYVQPPLSMNAAMTVAARLQSQDQIDNDYQGHISRSAPAGLNAKQRMALQGYEAGPWSENSYVNIYNVIYGHAAFQIDWGAFADGMQGPPRPHRANNHSGSFREVGIGNLTSLETEFPATNEVTKGPEVCTVEFASAKTSTPFITGVAYYDLDEDQFYSLGEGLGGIEVRVDGSDYYAVTSTSGGYSVPVPGNGTYKVTFKSLLTHQSISYNVTVSNNENVKQDLILSYQESVLFGSVSPPDIGARYYFDPVFGATSYQFDISTCSFANWVAGAEDGTENLTVDKTDSSYALRSTIYHSTGSKSYRLSFAKSKYVHQPESFELGRALIPQNGATMYFKLRRGFLATTSVLQVQTSEDGGVTWNNVANASYSGSGYGPDTSFSTESVNLPVTDKPLLIRFYLSAPSGEGVFSADARNNQPSGIFIDEISFTKCEELTNFNVVTYSAGAKYGNLNAQTVGASLIPGNEYFLRVRAKVGEIWFPYGSILKVVPVSASSLSDYDVWVQSKYFPIGETTSRYSGEESADYDGDGIPNGIERLFDLNPMDGADAMNALKPHVVGENIELSHPVIAGTTAEQIGAEKSLDLKTWTPVNVTISKEIATVVLPIKDPETGASAGYIRWKMK